MVELNKIYQAKQKIADFVLKTPFCTLFFFERVFRN